MRGRTVHLFLVVAFAATIGHVAWRILFAPGTVPEHRVGGEVPALCAPGSDAKQLYLRRMLYLPQQPRRAWLQVLGRDHLRVYVNGNLVEERYLDGFGLAIQADLAPLLQIGANVIAVVANRTSQGDSPVVGVDGAYELGGVDHPLRADDQWRYRTSFERKAFWWFQTQFDDRHWPFAAVTTARLTGKVQTPPRAITERGTGRWLTPPSLHDDTVAVRREFEVGGTPRKAWLRLTATASYRLALNGVLVDQREDQLSTTTPISPAQRTYNIGPLVRRGRNVLALVLTSPAGLPHLLADLEVEDSRGQRWTAATDGEWLQQPGLPADWRQAKVDDPLRWSLCHVETGDLDLMPWQPRRETVEVVLPWTVRLRELARQLGLMLAIGIATALLCQTATNLLLHTSPERQRRDGPVAGAPGLCAPNQSRPERAAVARCVYLALLPAAVALGGAILATYDPRVVRQDVYRLRWLLLALASVPLQWLLLGLWRGLRPEGAPPPRPSGHRGPSLARTLLVLALAGCGFWLRFKDIAAEPLHPDEWWNYTATKGFLERWFPSVQNHEDLPTSYASTYEIMPLCGPALVALVYDRDYLVVRLPSIIWATLTIVLLYRVGRRMFSPATGLVAAALFAFSPIAIQMANFGRYYSQLPFLTLLAVYHFWHTIRRTGAPLNRRALWLCVGSFWALYLTWEAGALVAVGMMVAAVIHRRGHLRSMLVDPAVWVGMLVLLLGIGLQYTNRELQQILRLWYGSGGSDVTLVPMWRFPIFQPWFYLWESTWNPDAFLPMVGLLGAGVLAIRHSFRRPLLFLLVVYLTTVTVLGLLLPLFLWRYAYWQSPLLVLLASAALVGAVRTLVHLPRQLDLPATWQWYKRGVAAFVVVVLVALGCGSLVQLSEMDRFRTSGYRQGQLKFPHLQSAADYLKEHFEEGDVVITTLPHVLDHYWGRKSDYWLQTLLSLQASIDDKRTLPLHKICGTVMIPDIATVDHVITRARRVWYVAVPLFHEQVNDPKVSAYILQHMDVVFEDFWATILLIDNTHRTQGQHLTDQKALINSNFKILQ